MCSKFAGNEINLIENQKAEEMIKYVAIVLGARCGY